MVRQRPGEWRRKDTLPERLNRTEALKLVQVLLRNGVISVSTHATEELKQDSMTMVDVDNVLRCGRIIREPELINGTYRYRVETQRMCIVVAFRSRAEMRIVTAWRKQ